MLCAGAANGWHHCCQGSQRRRRSCQPRLPSSVAAAGMGEGLGGLAPLPLDQIVTQLKLGCHWLALQGRALTRHNHLAKQPEAAG